MLNWSGVCRGKVIDITGFLERIKDRMKRYCYLCIRITIAVTNRIVLYELVKKGVLWGLILARLLLL